MTEEKKNIFEKTLEVFTKRDKKEAEEKADEARIEKEEVSPTKAAAERAFAGKAAADQAAAERVGVKAAAGLQQKGTVKVRSLHVRRDHSTSAPEVGGLGFGDEVTVLDTWSDGKNTWAMLGPDRWAAITYDGETLIDLS